MPRLPCTGVNGRDRCFTGFARLGSPCALQCQHRHFRSLYYLSNPTISALSWPRRRPLLLPIMPDGHGCARGHNWPTRRRGLLAESEELRVAAADARELSTSPGLQPWLPGSFQCACAHDSSARAHPHSWQIHLPHVDLHCQHCMLLLQREDDARRQHDDIAHSTALTRYRPPSKIPCDLPAGPGRARARATAPLLTPAIPKTRPATDYLVL